MAGLSYQHNWPPRRSLEVILHGAHHCRGPGKCLCLSRNPSTVLRAGCDTSQQKTLTTKLEIVSASSHLASSPRKPSICLTSLLATNRQAHSPTTQLTLASLEVERRKPVLNGMGRQQSCDGKNKKPLMYEPTAYGLTHRRKDSV